MLLPAYMRLMRELAPRLFQVRMSAVSVQAVSIVRQEYYYPDLEPASVPLRRQSKRLP